MRRIALAVVLVLAAGFLVTSVVPGEEDGLLVTADFHDTTGLYVGNDVEYLGVPVGEVLAIEPRGTTMRVSLRLDPGTQVPADAGAEILQSSLVTDRYVEVGPAYTGGATLADGARIPVDHTRSPATIDEVTESIGDLVRALDGTTSGGRDVGDLLAVTADGLDGNGRRIRDALVAGERALQTVNARGPALKAVTADLAHLVDALADRDTVVRRFASDVATSAEVVAGQRRSLRRTLASLADLADLTTRFVRRNRAVVGTDLARTLSVARVVHRRQAQLAEAFDTMPTLAENLARAYDWKRQRLRVQFSLETGPFTQVFRTELCDRIGLPLCDALFAEDGSGLLDGLLDALIDLVPGNLP